MLRACTTVQTGIEMYIPRRKGRGKEDYSIPTEAEHGGGKKLSRNTTPLCLNTGPPQQCVYTHTRVHCLRVPVCAL